SVELSGGSLSAGTIDNTAGGSFDFTGGSLNLNSGLAVGDAGPLGNTLALSSQMNLQLQNSNTLTIDATGSVAINGGSLVVGNIVNNSASNVAFNSGTLVLNNSGLNVSENGLLGNTVLIDGGKTLRVESMTVGNETGATDIVNQTGGIVRTNSDLLVQNGGEYNISGGDLDFSWGNEGGITVTGNMNQTGGVVYGVDTLTLGSGGTYVFDGGALYVTNIDRSAGGAFVFNSGYLGSSTTNIIVDATGLLGDNINLTQGKELGLGMMTLSSTGSVVVNGGSLDLYDGIDNSAGGSFTYQAGHLSLYNYDLGIQGGGLLGASVTVNEGDSLHATNIGVGNLGYAGVLNINGGSVSASSINIYGEAYGPGPIGEVNFNSGTLSVGGDIVHDGSSFDILKNVSNIDASKNLRVGGVLTLDGVGMTLGGGNLSAGKIVGNFNFNSGNLTITSDNLTIGSGGLLGKDVYFSNSKSLSLYGYNDTGNVNIAGDGKLVMNGGSLRAESITNHNKLVMNSGYVGVDSVDNNGTIRIEDGATMSLWDENTGGAEYVQHSGSTVVNGTLDVNGVVSIEAGTISGSGTLNADLVIGASGTLLPGNSPGTLEINGDLDMLIGSILKLEIESDGAGGYLYDQLFVSGEYDLQGLVQFSLLDGVDESIFESEFDMGNFFKDAGGIGLTDLSVFDNAEILAVNGTDWFAIDFDAETGAFISSPTTSPVPVPAAVWLFGSGLIGLIGVARRRAKAA
ncbi:MAG: VPLPA-CTERM sorting domain-containing protein, partial [Gammaproteobacteria bacterium]|nr:VPLPA-CTERM sorting domain-containing protein [Gammaproteobacteria bacterium]